MAWDWMTDVSLWYQQDLSANINTDKIRQNLYVAAVAIEYGKAAKSKWAQEWFGKSKIHKLDSLMPIGSDGSISFVKRLPDAAMNYIAQNTDDDFRRAHAQKAREFASQLLLNKLRMNAWDLVKYFRSDD